MVSRNPESEEGHRMKGQAVRNMGFQLGLPSIHPDWNCNQTTGQSSLPKIVMTKLFTGKLS